jgi:hypothetical protein
MTVAVDRAKYKIRAPYPGLQGLFAAVDAAVVVFKVSSSGFHGIAVACTHAGTSPHHKDTLVHERGWAVFTDRGIPGDGIRNKEGHGRRACPRTCFQGFKTPALVFPFGLQLADPFGEGLVFFLETPYPLIEKKGKERGSEPEDAPGASPFLPACVFFPLPVPAESSEGFPPLRPERFPAL